MSQEDILSYIVTGHPASDNALLEGGAGGDIGQADGVRPAVRGHRGSRRSRARFDVFQIKQEGAGGLNLTAGRYISDRLFLNLKLPLGSNTNPDPGDTLGPGFELEYFGKPLAPRRSSRRQLPPGFSFRGRHAY